MTALFFALLPTDVQIDVFRTWLKCCDDGLRNISSLDVACCNRSLRPQLLLLAACAGRGCSIDVESNRDTFQNVLRWLLSRGVEAKVLSVSGSCVCPQTMEVIPSIENVHCSPTERADEMATLFNACPNVSILSVDCDDQEGTATGAGFWAVLASAQVPGLREFRFNNSDGLSDCVLVFSALQRIGDGLQKFDFMELGYDDSTAGPRGNMLLQALADSCHMLQTVSMTAFGGTADHVIRFMQANRQLQEVSFFMLSCTVSDVNNILATTGPHQSLNKFRCLITNTFPKVNHDSDGEAFVGILERFPFLDSLAMFDCEYVRSKGSLKLSSKLSPASLECIVAACSPVRELAPPLLTARRIVPSMNGLASAWETA